LIKLPSHEPFALDGVGHGGCEAPAGHGESEEWPMPTSNNRMRAVMAEEAWRQARELKFILRGLSSDFQAAAANAARGAALPHTRLARACATAVKLENVLERLRVATERAERDPDDE
jgi:hypothetical protein